jgi:hypothetical protein
VKPILQVFGLVALIGAIAVGMLIGFGYLRPAAFTPHANPLALPSGRTVPVVLKGPVDGEGWKGLGVTYLADTEDPVALAATADELAAALRAEAEKNGFEVIVVYASYVVGRDGPFTDSRTHAASYERAGAEWRRTDRFAERR